MNFQAIFQRIMNLVTKSPEEWDTIQHESTTQGNLYLKFAIFIYAIPSVALFLGSLFGRAPFGYAFLFAFVFFLLTLLAVWGFGFAIDLISMQFGATKDMLISQKLSVYSLVPYGVAGIIYILPLGMGYTVRWLVSLIGLYSFYILFIGLGKLKNISKEKIGGCIAILAIIGILLQFLVFEISMRIYINMIIPNPFRSIY